MIEPKEGGFHSMEEIEASFDAAYEQSLIMERKFPDNYLNSSDDVPRLLTVADGVLDQDYASFYNKLLLAKTGAETDYKMASLESYARPELQNAVPAIDMDELKLIHIFKIEPIQLTESRKKRLIAGTEDWPKQEIEDFMDAVESLDKNSNNLALF